MELYNLIIYKTIVFHIPQKNRTIKKIYYKKIGIIEKIPANKITQQAINIKKSVDWSINISIVNTKDKNNTIDAYYEKLNKKSQKQYMELKQNKDLLKYNIDFINNYFKIKYDRLINNADIIKELLKNIDVIKDKTSLS